MGEIERLERKRDRLRAQLTKVGDIRLGSLFRRTRRCGKPTCACAQPDHPGHPGWFVSKSVGGKTVMAPVPDDESVLARVRGQLEEGRRFRALCEAFAQAGDELSKRRLRDPRTGTRAVPEKKGSKRRSKRKSKGKSKR